MTSALKEIVDRYERLIRRDHKFEHEPEAGRCLTCEYAEAAISRARAELERGVDVHDVLTDYQDRVRRLTLMPDETASFNMHIACMRRALRDAGVRVVEDGKESSDGK